LFNVFNWANQVVGSNYSATTYAAQPGATPNPAFGKITSQLSAAWNTPRQAQLNVKFTF
jgi:hypothetical protein